MSIAGDLRRYQTAITTLENMGLQGPGWLLKSQKMTAEVMRESLRRFDLSKVNKAIVTSRENFAIVAAATADIEKLLQDEFIPKGRSFIADLEQRAYKAGSDWGVAQGAASGAGYVYRGVDAMTLRLIRTQAYELISGLVEDQIDYIRRTLTAAVLENHVWDVTMERMIRDGKIPALKIVDKNGFERVIDMQTRVENIVRTETGRIAELGSYDKSKEIWGEAELFGEWNTVGDENVRDKHAARAGEVRSAKDWETIPHSSDGRILLPGRDPRCRCWMRWGPREMFAEKLGLPVTPKNPATPTVPPKAKASAAAKAKKTPKPKPAPADKAAAKKGPIDYSVARPPLKVPKINTADDLHAWATKDLDLVYNGHFHDFKGMNKKALNMVAEGLSRARAQFKVKFSIIQGKGSVANSNGSTSRLGNIHLNRKTHNNPTDTRANYHPDIIKARVDEQIKHAEYIKKNYPDWATSDKPFTAARRKDILAAEEQARAIEVLNRWSVSAGKGPLAPTNTIVHEYGHNIHYRLPKALADEWDALYRNAPLIEKYKISEISNHNAKEMFAECFSAWTWGEEIDSVVYKKFIEIIEYCGKNWDEIYVQTMPQWEKFIGNPQWLPDYSYYKIQGN